MKTRIDVLIVFLLINFTAILVQCDSKESCTKPVKNEIEAPAEEVVEKQNEKSCRKIRDPEQPSIVIKGLENFKRVQSKNQFHEEILFWKRY